jgi:hypothetical protein
MIIQANGWERKKETVKNYVLSAHTSDGFYFSQQTPSQQ